MSTAARIAKRKNGLLASCEPCRRSKLRCDHSTPVCRRCARGGKSDLCVYHPSPTSRSERVSHPTGDGSPDIALWYQSLPNWDTRTYLPPPPGSLGLISCSGVFSENKNHLTDINAPSVFAGPEKDAPNLLQIHLGAQLLVMLFENLPLYENLARNFLNTSQEGSIIGYRLFDMIFTVLKNTHELWAMDTKSNKQNYFRNMQGWSQKIFDKTSNPVHTDSSMDLEEYINGISNRWECIGLIFSVVGQGAMAKGDWTSISQLGVNIPADQRALGSLIASASDICLQFCDGPGLVHDPLGWLLYQHTHLLTLVYGDGDYRPWRKLAQLSTVVFTLGLNQSGHSSCIPFFLSELRKRLMAAAYSMDKQLATFLGRPPQISSRFCDVNLPLDLSLNEILASPYDPDVAVNQLDASGWNTRGIVQKVQWLRVSLLTGSIREQILELSLRDCTENLLQEVQEISRHSHEIWNDLPGFLRWHTGSVNSADSESLLIPIYLDHLYNEFLLYRVLVRRTQVELATLIDISQRMLSTVLELIGKEITSGTGIYNIGWNAAQFGIPAASVLAIQLLCQTNEALQSPLSMKGRAEAIQNISVFTSHLQYVVRPWDGNFDICQHARHVLSHILNYVLSAKSAPFPSELGANVVTTDWLNGQSFLLDDGTDFLKWIDDFNPDALRSNSN